VGLGEVGKGLEGLLQVQVSGGGFVAGASIPRSAPVLTRPDPRPIVPVPCTLARVPPLGRIAPISAPYSICPRLWGYHTAWAEILAPEQTALSISHLCISIVFNAFPIYMV
jgi:hypothetical protein